MNWILVGWLAINFVLSTTSDVLAKVWAVTSQTYWFYVALAVSIFTTISFMLVVRSGGLSIGSTTALILTIIANITIGVLFFKEIVTPVQWFGIALGFVAVVLILRPA